jgi:hypothetical protein
MDAAPYDAIVEKLLSQTKNGKILWSAASHIERRDAVGLIYKTEVEHQDIVLYEYRYKTFDELEQPDWANEVAVEFVDLRNALELRFPPTDSRWALLREVRRKVSGVDAFAEKFLSSDDDDE